MTLCAYWVKGSHTGRLLVPQLAQSKARMSNFIFLLISHMSFVSAPSVPPPLSSQPFPLSAESQTLYTSSDVQLHDLPTTQQLEPKAGMVASKGAGGGRKRLKKEHGEPWNLRKQRRYRQAYWQWRNLLKEPWHLPITSMCLSAIAVQKVARGYIKRRGADVGRGISRSSSSLGRRKDTLVTRFLRKLPGGKDNPKAGEQQWTDARPDSDFAKSRKRDELRSVYHRKVFASQYRYFRSPLLVRSSSEHSFISHRFMTRHSPWTHSFSYIQPRFTRCSAPPRYAHGSVCSSGSGATGTGSSPCTL